MNRPDSSAPSSVLSSDASAARTDRPPLRPVGTWSLRYTLMPASFAVGATACTCGNWRIIGVAVVGRICSLPWSLMPLVTMSRLVPSWSICASSADWLELVTPSTDTIEAMPIAMPSPDSSARIFRERRPSEPVGSRSPLRNVLRGT